MIKNSKATVPTPLDVTHGHKAQDPIRCHKTLNYEKFSEDCSVSAKY